MMTIVYYDNFPMTFYKVPKYIYEMEEFENLSSDAIILYGLILDRASLSKKNEWKDKKDHYYVYLNPEDAAKILRQDVEVIKDYYKELQEYGLIEIFEKNERDALIYPKVAIGAT